MDTEYVDFDYNLAMSIYTQELIDREIAISINKVHKCTSIRDNERYIPCKRYSNEAIVILFPDNNDPVFSLHDIDLQKRMIYMTHVYHVYLKRVSTLQEAIGVVKEIKNKYKICELNIGGHGSATMIHWPGEIIKVGKKEAELRELFNLLEPGAPILTLSCQNGKSIRSKNMLQYIAGIARGHRVIGTTCNNGKHLKLKISCPKPLKIEYTNNGKDVTSTEICY